MRVTLLSGGTGGAKLARGLADAVGPGNLTVIANTGDDSEVHGAHESGTIGPFGCIDERG